MPEYLVAAHPAGDNCCTVVVKLAANKSKRNKFQIRKAYRNRLGRWINLGPTEFSIVRQYAKHDQVQGTRVWSGSESLVFDVQEPGSLETLHDWVKTRPLLGEEKM